MSKKILLIEDNEAIRKNTAAILELAGYEVATAENGKKGVAMALETNADLIVCDIEMPELDGYGVLHLLGKNPKTAHLPFIFLTARTDRADFRKGMEMGAEDYLTKPFDDVELLNAIEARLKKMDILKKEFAGNAEGINSFLNDAKTNGKIEFKFNENREIQLFRKKQLIYKQGSQPRYLYMVIKGKVKTYRENEYGKELITAICKEGDFVGFVALLDADTYHETAEALEDAELMVIPREEFISVISSDIRFAAKFIKLLTKDIAEKEEQLMNVAYNSLRKRVANGLLLANERFRIKPEVTPEIDITREDLARLVGVARESLIRTLSDFKTEKMIDIKDGKIVLLSEDKLKGLAN